MKKLLFILLFPLSLNAQYLFHQNDNTIYGDTWKQDLEYTVPTGILASGFITNTIYTNSIQFESLSMIEKRQNTFKIYSTFVIFTVGSHYLIKYLETKPFKKRRRRLFARKL